MIGNRSKCLNFSCQGESHKADNKVCQDFSFSSHERGVTVVIVCDGHGGNRYFRSDIGAKFASDVTYSLVRQFVRDIDSNLFKGIPFTSVGPVSELPDDYKETSIDVVFRQLFSSIIFQWNGKILEHAKSTPISEWETEHVEQSHLDEFQSGEHLEKIYGCTLMTYVGTKQYWFAFHIGDGKCISLQKSPIWSEPIPWDERCFLNKTTSLCDSDAINEFRYCYQGDGDFPYAIFLGSDGIDDSFGETENIVNFYIQLAKEIIYKSEDQLLESIKETLPELSKIGSKDDMSVAFAYNKDALRQLYPELVGWQIDVVSAAIRSCNERILSLRDRQVLLSCDDKANEKSRIEYKYTKSDLTRAFYTKKSLVKKIDILLQEKDGSNYSPYSDEIGVDNNDTTAFQ